MTVFKSVTPVGSAKGPARLAPVPVTASNSAPKSTANQVQWPQSFEYAPRDPPTIAAPDSAMLPRYCAEGDLTPREWGQQLREVVDLHLQPGNEGMVLVRGLPTATPADFSELMAGCSGATWTKRSYEPFGGPRKVVDGVDLATNIPPYWMLGCHNEMIYNPKPCDVIILACSQPAHSGGESLIARNADYNALVSSELQDYIKAHGGLTIIRRYSDATSDTPPPTGVFMSWQVRCGLDETSADRAAAEAAFLDKLGPGIDMQWDAEAAGMLTVTNVTSGFNSCGDWCNILVTLSSFGPCLAGDGTEIPGELLKGLQTAEAAAWRAVLLEAGDVLVLDNMRAAHGRVPFEDAEGSQRILFTHLADYV
eukprot:jgi/Ulvmu1/6102/UM027_0080.1